MGPRTGFTGFKLFQRYQINMMRITDADALDIISLDVYYVLTIISEKLYNYAAATAVLNPIGYM